MDKKLLADFQSPPSAYRGKPFWAWNGKLDPEELRRQIRILHRMGLGGFFMHSRVGLNTAYLGDDWFKCIDACIDEAKKLGMEAWLYDEDRWPSGAAGGLVTKNPKYRMRELRLEVIDQSAGFKWNDEILAAFAARISGPVASDVQRLSKNSLRTVLAGLGAEHKLLVFKVAMQGCSPWYNGYTYLDVLNEEAVAQYLKVTHEAYRKRCGEHFGKTVPGIFTDEPNYGHMSDAIKPWTDKLPAVFKKRYGYDLMDRLVEVFYDIEGQEMSQARWHYFDCITHLFVTNFTKQIGQWCEKNGVQFTGHMLNEDTLRMQSRVVGSCMRHYEWMQAPGMDLLTEHWRIYTTAKQLSSAARQFGAKWRLTEIYGCTGWDFPFEAHKALGDWEVATGINLRCQHLSWYTMLGEAKRDYPAGIFYQSPWWEYYSKVEDYFARVTAVMTRGVEVRDLLVIHPVESMWTMMRMDSGNDPAVKQYDQMPDAFNNALLGQQIDFDYGDEELLSRHAKVAKDNGNGATLKVGKATYKAILVPPLKTIRATTVALLKKYKEAGGKIVFTGPVAGFVDAKASDALQEVAAGCTWVAQIGRELADAVAPECRRIKVSDSSGQAPSPVIYLLREDKENFYLFVANTSHLPAQCMADPLVRDRREAFSDVRISGFAGCEGAPIELDPETGAMYAADATRQGGGWEIRTSLPRIGSRLYVVGKRVAEAAPAPRPVLKEAGTQSLSTAEWAITLSEPNVLVLDRPKFRLGQGDWQPHTEILRVDRAVRKALGVPARGGSMVQPWAREAPARPKRASVALSYEFEVRHLPGGQLLLAIEQPRRFEIRVNGQSIDTDTESGWWVDRSLQTLRIDPAILRIGPNEIQMVCDFDETFSGLEIVYLLGDFGAAVNGTEVAITAPPASLRIGDWVEQGLPFYSGSVTYRQKVSPRLWRGQRVFVRLGDYRGVAARVLVDGKAAGVIAWEPSEVEITHLLGEGPVDLAIEVLGHRRNSHGPHHLNEKWPQWTGPGGYVVEGERWLEGYQLVPCGLMADPMLVMREG